LYPPPILFEESYEN